MTGFTIQELTSGSNNIAFSKNELQNTQLNNQMPEVGTYTQDDMVENDTMFNIIEDYMLDRYGIQSVEDKDRRTIVDDFLDNRRGVSGGNTVRGLTEIDYIYDIKKSPQRMAKAKAAYELYENMAGLFSKETSFAEKAEGVMDYTRTAILDPANIVGGIFGKILAGGSVRVALAGARKLALKEGQKVLRKTGDEKLAKKAVEKVLKKELKAAQQKGAKELGDYKSQLMNNKGLKKLKTSQNIKEIGGAVAFDAAVNTGMEYIYQSGLIQTGVRDDIDKFALGTAFVGSTIIGGVQIGRVLFKGTSDVAMPSAVVVPKADDVLNAVSKSMEDYSKTVVEKTSTWKTKVKEGRELEDLDSEFFVDLLLGHQQDGEVMLKGFAQIASERGLTWSKRFEEDKYSDWIAEIIKDSKPEDIKKFITSFEKATGTKLKQAKELTVEEFANTFARKINNSARILNAASQGSKINGISVEDLTIGNLINDAVGLGLLPKEYKRGGDTQSFIGKLGDKLPTGEAVNEVITNNQGRVIRLLVSNPSTSALNVIGWGSNASLNFVSDMSLALVHAGKGELLRAIGKQKRGESATKIASDLFRSNMNRVRLLLDPEMTHSAFQSALLRNSEALQRLSTILPGGVENTTKTITGGKLSPSQKLLGLKIDDAVDAIQAVSLVRAQDSFTKSQEFIFQMDKALRTTTGKGWSEFYSDKDAYKFMATKEYRALEASAVDRTLEAIFSKSYKGKGALGQMAGIMEDARNIPGVGLMIPFGRFFNNTVDFGLQATGLSLVGKMSGLYKDKPTSQLIAKAASAWTIASFLVQDETRKRKQGLGLYEEDVMGGEVITQRYDYPISYFKAKARMISYLIEEGEVPPEILAQVGRDFSLGGVLRNLTKTQTDVANMVNGMLSGDLSEAWKGFNNSAGGIVSQVASAGTRFIEPVNTLAGITRGEQARPIDRYQGNKLYNDSVRYIDNIIPLFTGEPVGKTLKQAATGEADVTSAKSLGFRNIRLTNTQRVMNMMGYDQFNINAARRVRVIAPESANEYNGILFDIIEAESDRLIGSKNFRKLETDRQRLYWKKEVLPRAKETAKTFLYLQYSGATDTLDLQYELSEKYTSKKIDSAIEDLKFDGDFGDMNRGELYVLKTFLETEDKLKLLSVPLL
tara:strand:+ start:2439 stop:5894 length:3456 start_codon:yes stop_codon:yes gene_type:complete